LKCLLTVTANKLDQNSELRAYRLIFVTPYYWPEFSACTMLYGSLCSGLVESGMQVTVLTNGGWASDSEPFPVQPYFRPDVEKCWNPFLRRKGILLKILEYLSFTVFVMWKIMFSRRTDAVFLGSNPPLIALPVGLISYFKKIKIIYNLQDLFPDSALALELIDEKGVVFKTLKLFEKLNYKFSNKIITICNLFADHVRKLESDIAIEVIPNWVDTEFMIKIPRGSNKFLSRIGLCEKFIVLYAGNLGYSHNLDVIVEAAARLAKHEEIHFLFVGDGNRKVTTMKNVEKLGLSNCTFIGFQPFSDLPEVYSSCDLGVVSMRPGSEASAVPSKTWNYLSCSVPVIACVNSPSELAEVILDSGAGLVLPAIDSESLARAIFDLYQSPSRCAILGAKGREYVCNEISRQVIVEKYKVSLQEVMRSGRKVQRH